MADDDRHSEEDERVVSAPPENLCVCFHVPLRKVVKFVRLEKPKVASQLSNCHGAGTGCGWCIPFLEKVFDAMERGDDPEETLELNHRDYLARRQAYLKSINAERMKDDLGSVPLKDRIEPDESDDER